MRSKSDCKGICLIIFHQKIKFAILVVFLCTSACKPRELEDSRTQGLASSADTLDGFVADAFRNNRHYMKILDDGNDALLARIFLFQNARHQIDVQTFIWDDDETGRYFFYELMRAAQRGVHVRILVDGQFALKNADFVAFIHKNYAPSIEIRYYNPTGTRIKPNFLQRILHVLTDFRDFNQRMHNKVIAVDHSMAIVGGRNIQNAYYERASGLNFRDRDAFVIGSAADDATRSFDEFWNDVRSVPSNEMNEVQRRLDEGIRTNLSRRSDFQLNTMFDDIDSSLADPEYMVEHLARRLVAVDQLEFWADKPGKNSSRGLGGGGRLSDKFYSLIKSARRSLLIQSPYFILSDSAKDLFEELSRHTEIKISTNSLINTDQWLTYSATFKQRRFLLSLNSLSLFEYMPFPADLRSVAPRYDANRDYYRDSHTPRYSSPDQLIEIPNDLGDDPYLCIHAKGIVVDDRYAIIGSYNMDPRSANINTEVGIITANPTISGQLRWLIERDMAPRNSWVIGIKQRPFGGREIENIFGNIFEVFPLDLWLLSSSTTFGLADAGQVLSPHSPEFYRNYTDLGLFPMMDPLRHKAIMTHMSKVWVENVVPIL